jgi:hypothetical protein
MHTFYTNVLIQLHCLRHRSMAECALYLAYPAIDQTADMGA